MPANEHGLPSERDLARYVERMLATTPDPGVEDAADDAHPRETVAAPRTERPA